MSELVSCVLATRNRPRFLQQAIRCFLRQTYEPSELIVVDDSDDPVEPLPSSLDRVRYIRLPQPTPTGAKLNLAIEHSRGTVIQKLDDDDYYHPDFLSVAVSSLPPADRDRALVAWDCFLVLLAGENHVRYSGHGWTAGGTFCFFRQLWQKQNFRDVPVDEDYWFLNDHSPSVVRVCAPEHYLLVRHGANTWTMMAEGERADEFLATLPAYDKPLDALVDPTAGAFYRSLAYQTAS